MGKAGGEPLEVIDTWSSHPGSDPTPGPGPGPGRPGGGHRRFLRPIVVMVVILVAGLAVAFPVRVQLSSAQVRGLDRVWSTAIATDVELHTLATRIASRGEGSEPASVLDAAYAALDREEASRLRQLRGQLPGRWSLDGGVRGLHATLSAALASEATDLQAAATGSLTGVARPERSTATNTLVAVADRLLTRRLADHRLPALGVAVPSSLTAADGLLATMAGPSDHPLPLEVLTARGGELWTYDLSRGRVVRSRPGHLPFAPVEWLPGPGYALASDGGSRAAVVPDNPAAAVTTVVDVIGVAASVTPGRWWAARTDGSVVGIDRAGTVVAGPLSPAIGRLGGAVPAGLVLTNPGIEVIDPATGTTVQVISSDPDALVLDVSGTTIAWTVAFTPTAVLHLTSTVTGHTSIVARSLDRDPNGFGPLTGLSPNGDRYSSTFLASGKARTGQIGLVDTTTGAYRPLASGIGAAGSQPQISWSADGRWLIALSDNTGGGTAIDTTTGATTPLRLDPTSTLLETAPARPTSPKASGPSL